MDFFKLIKLSTKFQTGLITPILVASISV